MSKTKDRKGLYIIIAIAIILMVVAINLLKKDDLVGIAKGNGRLEATEIDISTKFPGRIEKIIAKEGEFVSKGDLLAKMELDSLEAQLYESKAQYYRTIADKERMLAQVTTRKSQRDAALASVDEQKAALKIAESTLSRLKGADRAIAIQRIEEQESVVQRQINSLKTAEANVVAAESSIKESEAMVFSAEATVAAAEATVRRVEVDIKDSNLVAPVNGRIQYRIAEEGEVLGNGGKVLNLVDLSDAYMSFFLPTEIAGRLSAHPTKGSEVRIILDAAPEYVIPATVTFVSAVSQFTPKTVETKDERTKLMFRVKATIDPELLIKHQRYIKTGVTGDVYVKYNPNATWPARLETKLPKSESVATTIDASEEKTDNKEADDLSAAQADNDKNKDTIESLNHVDRHE